MKITTFIVDPGHSFRTKKIKGGQRIFDYGAGIYANDKQNVYPIKDKTKVKPISIYRVHDPCGVAPMVEVTTEEDAKTSSPTVGIATHIWWHRVLDQLSMQRKDYSKYVRWVVAGTIIGIVMLFVFAG